MRYEGTVYRPPSEANSLLIQATIGCPHNKCTFCGMYKGTKFRLRKVAEIKEDLQMARDHYGDWIKTVFFPDGNTIIMKTNDLLEIFNFTRQMFPRLERITVYGSARFIVLKTLDELKQLKEAGLARIHSGMESGDDIVLQHIQKGTTAEQLIQAGRLVKDAGIELSEYVLLGIGGRRRTVEHAVNSAVVLNAIDPDFIRLRTYTPHKKTPLYQELKSGEFQLPSPHEIIREIRLFIENLHVTSRLYSDHISNYVDVNGRLPADQAKMLALLDYALTVDESQFTAIDYHYL